MTDFRDNSTTFVSFVPVSTKEVPADDTYRHLATHAFRVQRDGIDLGVVWTPNGALWFNSVTRWHFTTTYHAYPSRSEAATALIPADDRKVTFYTYIRNPGGKRVPLHIPAKLLVSDGQKARITFIHPTKRVWTTRTVNACQIGAAKGQAA